MYYHFNSKEEIFNFLVEEGMKLLKNSIEIKISKCNNTTDKLKAISLIQLKAIKKYEDLLTIILSQIWGNENRNIFCKEKAIEYIDVIKKVVEEGLEKGDIKKCNAEIFASEIFSLTCATLIYKRKMGIEQIDIAEIYEEYENNLFNN